MIARHESEYPRQSQSLTRPQQSTVMFAWRRSPCRHTYHQRVTLGDIVESIDKMVTNLKAEYKEDLYTKSPCESDRMVDVKIAKQNAQGMDNETARVARKQATIDERRRRLKTLSLLVCFYKVSFCFILN